MQKEESDVAFADLLKDEITSMWEKELYNHPFVVELAAGKLPRRKYENYLIQNHYFLIEYVRCLAIAATRAKDPATMGLFLKLANHTMQAELLKFDEFAMSFGIKQSDLDSVKPLVDNLAYTGFLFNAASAGSSAEAAASICPCVWSYSDIGRKVAPALAKYYGVGSTDASMYENYHSPEFMERLHVIKWIISDGAKKTDELGRSRIRHYFRAASEFEKRFWDMGYTSEV